MSDQRLPTKIASHALSAEIDPLGAQLFALRDADGRDLLWNGDPAVWTGRAPILFPIVGALERGRYHLDGEAYPLARHGFARHSLFQIARADGSAALFRLRASEETLKVYPFQFELDLEFTLADDKLTLAAQVRNLGDRTMPASFGFHPALRWPLPYDRPRAEHRVRFDHDEPEPIRRLNTEGVLKLETFPTPVQGRDLALQDQLFVDDAVIFDRLNSRKLSYGAPTGPQIEVAFPGAPYLGVWTKPGGGFICIEPWWGIADPAGFDGDVRTKPGVFEVGVGETKTVAMSLRLAT